MAAATPIPTNHHQTATDEDRLSALPDEILRRILIAADLDTKSSVQTSILSRRWITLWKSSLTKLDFLTPNANDDEKWLRFGQFVDTVLLSFHNREYYSGPLPLLSVAIHCRLSPDPDAPSSQILGRISAHGLANRVRTFRLIDRLELKKRELHHGQTRPIPPGLTALCGSVENLEISLYCNLYMLRESSSDFAAVRTLRLYRCVFNGHTRGDADYDPLRVVPNLTKVEMVECQLITTRAIRISGDKLTEIVVAFSNDRPQVDWINIFGPNVRSFKCENVKPGQFRSIVLPSLECLDFDIQLGEVSSRQECTEASLNCFRMFRGFEFAQRVKLQPSAIMALTWVPGLLEREASPFKRVECLELLDRPAVSSRRVFNSLVSYFFDECIRGPTFFQHTFGTQQDASDPSRPVVVSKKDLSSCLLLPFSSISLELPSK